MVIVNAQKTNMNGKSVILKQINGGVRDMVSDIDELRLYLGCENVKVQTPKVENRLRHGYNAAIPMQLSCNIIDSDIIAHFILPRIGYPSEVPLAVTFDGCFKAEALDKTVAMSQQRVENGNFPKAVDVLKFFKICLQEIDDTVERDEIDNAQVFPCAGPSDSTFFTCMR
jgi:hypothetical protein